jgi:hypothetical protein
VFVGPDDKIYVGVALRDEATRRNASSQAQPGEQRGIVVGNAIDGSLLAFIPDPSDLNSVGAGTSHPVLRLMQRRTSMRPMSVPTR